MKIAVSTSNGGKGDQVCPRFGRCPTFTLIEADEKGISNVNVIPNPGAQAGGGAGIVAAQAIINSAAQAVITGNCGPNSIGVLLQAGIKVYLAAGTVESAVNQLVEGKLHPLTSPNVPPYSGMGQGMGGRGAGPGGGQGRGLGRGGGRGQGSF